MSTPISTAAPAPSRRKRGPRVPPSVLVGAALVAVIGAAAAFAPFVAPTNPLDVGTFDLMNAELPPAFMAEGDAHFLLGTDNQGRDLLSAMLYGARVSIAIGGGAVLVAASVGIVLGLLAGYFGGWVDALIMRVGDVILSLPTILLALLVSGVARAVFPEAGTAQWAPVILIGAIAIHEWVQYARTVRAATMVETRKDYVRAARVIGLPSARIMARHILPNVLSPVIVIATINLAAAVLTEATLSFLGVGMPPTYPSLGTLIRIGNEFVFSGIWWIAVFPAALLVVLVLGVNIVGDWLRDWFNPRRQAR
ncbi:ABC transporter permease [Alsobacter sp. SYSU M60028]|uniref:ABC transporter permease n=1 Tax=Alsobacter ponti TaxID=2962936 RepID=A0ABT1LH29_9HYPH|nr:ABC transporter permease [Alsobacter ponti]MCP8940759.1 ABC transporter permease [Alsobacter ponti]